MTDETHIMKEMNFLKSLKLWRLKQNRTSTVLNKFYNTKKIKELENKLKLSIRNSHNRETS